MRTITDALEFRLITQLDGFASKDVLGSSVRPIKLGAGPSTPVDERSYGGTNSRTTSTQRLIDYICITSDETKFPAVARVYFWTRTFLYPGRE